MNQEMDTPTMEEASSSTAAFQDFQPHDTFSLGPAPEWVFPREVPWDTASQPDEHVHMLLVETHYAPARRMTYERTVRRLNTVEAVQKLSQVELDYDPHTQNLCIHELRLWRNGQSKSFAERARFFFRQREGSLEAQILHGRVSAIAVLEDVRPGDAVELCYTLTSTHEIEGKQADHAFLLERTIRTGAWRVVVVQPSGQPLSFQASDGKDHPPEHLESGTESFYIWTGSQDVPEKEEPGVPAWHSPLAWLQISSYQSWNEVARVLAAGWEKSAVECAEAREFVVQLYDSHDPTPVRVTKAIRWVQDNVRYLGLEIGLGGLLPSGPDVVLRRRYGDCKDKSLLLVSMLRALGVESHPLLVHTAFRGSVAKHLPGLFSFNHAIVTFVFDGQRGFADPTATGSGGDCFHQSLPHYEYGLCLDHTTTELLPIPHVGLDVSSWVVQEEFYLNPVGRRSHLVQRIEATGFEADMLRARLSLVGREVFAETEAKDLHRFFADAKITGPSRVRDDRDKNIIRVASRFEFKEWGRDLKNNQRQFNYNPRWIYQFLACPSAQPPRRHPFQLRYPFWFRQVILVEGNLRVGRPENYAVTCPWMEARTTVRWIRRNRVKLEYQFEAKARQIEAETVPDFIKKFEEMTKNLGCNLVLSKTPAWTTVLAKAIKPRSWFRRKKKRSRGRFGPKAGWQRREMEPPQDFQKGYYGRWSIQNFARDWRYGFIAFVALCRVITALIPQQNSGMGNLGLHSNAGTDQGNLINDPITKHLENALAHNDLSTAETDLAQMKLRYPHDPELSKFETWIAYKKNLTEVALAQARLTLQRHPDNTAILNIAGDCCLRLNQFAEAWEFFSRVPRFSSTDSVCWKGMAKADFMTNQWDRALAEYKKSHELNPLDVEVTADQISILQRLGRSDEALQTLEAAILENPQGALLHDYKGTLLRLMGRMEDSLAAYDEALKIEPNRSDTLASKAITLVKLGKPDEALPLARAVLQDSTSNLTAIDFAAQALALGQSYPEAIEAHSKMLGLHPNKTYAENCLGYDYLLAGDLAQARTHLEKALEIEPRNVDAWVNLRNLCEKSGDLEKQKECEEKLVQLGRKPVPTSSPDSK